jgi:antitoxin component YwqK of YwqJK toxin-antitoxin module
MKLPSLDRVRFYLLHESELAGALAESFIAYGAEHPDWQPSDAQEALIAWARMATDVPNGGFTQFFFNHRGDRGTEALATLLDSIGVPKTAATIRDALAVFRDHRSKFAVENPWDGLFGSIKEFDRIDRAFARQTLATDRKLETWIRSHIAELATDEAGEPIDAEFTGSVETLQPSGLVHEYLEVKKGKPHGAHREFFDDGTVRKVTFYKAGMTSGDFWPDGRLKRKESKRGPLTIIEWFHLNGSLQKRYVKDRTGYAVEPTRLYHENGSLAEEINVVEGKKTGPWLKFFDDGSPELEAEYAAKERLIVHNAWNNERKQVVKDGAGVFCEDGRSIDWEYSVFFPNPSTQFVTELKDGIPHGKRTSYTSGVLWSIATWRAGVEEGETTTYWDNGRVQSVTKFSNGKRGKSRDFPKFDIPVPAVVLEVEADAKLYAAWQHLPVDEYPRVTNLAEVRKELRIPTFLQEVHERNLAGTITSDYEDCNTFDDGIAYFLAVSAEGIVTSARANVSSVYSGGSWDIYLPLLRKLRFEPGRIRGRAVECQVLAWVKHTFVEGKNLQHGNG